VQKKALKYSFAVEKSQSSLLPSTQPPNGSPEKKNNAAYTPERLLTPQKTAKSNEARGIIHLSTPNSQISTLSTGTPTSTSSSVKSKVSSPSPKRTLRLWTTEEDRVLLETIATNDYNLIWPKIAAAIPGRTGKQCRERYLNHLKPSVKLTSWSVAEDAMIFRLYSVEGSKWSRMVKHLPGRTDNSIKNRYHHLKRRFERRMQSVGISRGMTELMKKIQFSRLFHGAPVDPLLLKYLSLRMLEGKRHQKKVVTTDYKFGPQYLVTKRIGCQRCGLIIPSLHTGRYICVSNGWCQTCCGLSPVVTGDALRIVHTIENER
jgi:hypothetical protein